MSVRGRRVFAVGASAYSWDDVVSAARVWGDWAQLERHAREGVAEERRAARHGEVISERAVDDAGREFRYARRLLAADEFRVWVARWGLTVEDWVAYLRRDLLRQASAGNLGSEASPPGGSDEEVQRVIWAEAVCSGGLERLARKLAERAAAHRKLTGSAPRGDYEGMEASFRRLCARAVTAEAIEEQIATNRMDWLRADVCRVALESEEAAREAAMGVRVDEMELGQVASDAGAVLARERLYLDSVDPELRRHLLSAQAGELIGPVSLQGEFWLLELLDKAAPSAEDPEIRARAERRLIERAAEEAVLSEVRWYEHPAD